MATIAAECEGEHVQDIERVFKGRPRRGVSV
jgi:hypothetical protein